jgi:hypothetical protein
MRPDRQRAQTESLQIDGMDDSITRLTGLRALSGFYRVEVRVLSGALKNPATAGFPLSRLVATATQIGGRDNSRDNKRVRLPTPLAPSGGVEKAQSRSGSAGA